MNTDSHIYIIAEAGVNHNGSLELAKQLVDVAVEAKADAVKFQTFKAEKVVSQSAPKAEYQTQFTEISESQLEMIKRLELSEHNHKILIDYCNERNIQFLSTPFDLESVDFLSHILNLPKLKLPSGEITNAPLLLKAAQTFKPIILSTGMSTLGEVETALGVLAFGYTQTNELPSIASFQSAYRSELGQQALKAKVTLLHCVTEYPTPFHEVNLKAMDTLKAAFGLTVGFSDHTLGIAIPIAAVARGAMVIEKHFTLSRADGGVDSAFSMEPAEMNQLVIETERAWTALGKISYGVTEAEKNSLMFRRSLYISQNMNKGDILTPENLKAIRPGLGISPKYYDILIGKAVNRDVKRGSPMNWELLA